MGEFKMNKMKRAATLFLACAFLLAVASCAESQIKTFAVENCAVAFSSTTNAFSLKGMQEDTRDLAIPVDLIGVPVDYDREIELEMNDSTAVPGRDFTILSKTVPAGAVKGSIVIRVNKLSGDVEERAVRMHLVPNEYFRAGPPASAQTDVVWSEAYVRPRDPVWQYWYTFFCHGYSKDYHRLLVEFFGEEIETVTNKRTFADNDPSLVYKLPTWWYNANREFRDFVSKHDQANPGSPWRHSDDYEQYKGWGYERGAGQKPAVLPTILETLNIL